MTQTIHVHDQEWKSQANRYKYCQFLEDGNILFFPTLPFDFPKEEIDFLLAQKQTSKGTRKNIAYKPQSNTLSNHDAKDKESGEQLKEVLKNYSARVTDFLTTLLAPYAADWKHDYASFRPFQEKGRKLRTRARNDLLHVDAFPTRPLHGDRILRFFTNINPMQSRRWITSDGFAELAQKYVAHLSKTSFVSYGLKNRLLAKIKLWLKQKGIRLPARSPYDAIMLKLHNFLKENQEFQKECKKDHWEFPPFSCWAVFTDQVSHAAIAGQYALEQTFRIPRNALLHPEKAPIAVLERLTGHNLVDALLVE